MISFVFSPVLAALALSSLQETEVPQETDTAEAAQQSEAIEAALPGEYRDRSSFEMFHGLLIREDGTYEWAISVGAMDRRSTGTWEMSGSGAVLTTTPTPVAPVFEQAASDPSEDAPFLLVSWPNGNGIAGINFVLQCGDGKQISHYTQSDGWNLVPGECDEPVSISLEESIHEIGPAYFNFDQQEDGQIGGLRFTLVPNDMGVENMTGTTVFPTEGGVLLGLRGDFVEMVRVERD